MEVLTRTENRVAHLVASGFSEKEIAGKLFVQACTISSHTKNIRKKIGARNMVDVARMYILSLDDPKKVFFSLVFVAMQMFMVVSESDLEARRPVRSASCAKIVRVRTNKA